MLSGAPIQEKWMVVAERRDGRWEVNAPEPVPQDAELIEQPLFGKRRVLAGFDFPIGKRQGEERP